jgi:hypothetical protein
LAGHGRAATFWRSTIFWKTGCTFPDDALTPLVASATSATAWRATRSRHIWARLTALVQRPTWVWRGALMRRSAGMQGPVLR